jgi:hypothetical protein
MKSNKDIAKTEPHPNNTSANGNGEINEKIKKEISAAIQRETKLSEQRKREILEAIKSNKDIAKGEPQSNNISTNSDGKPSEESKKEIPTNNTSANDNEEVNERIKKEISAAIQNGTKLSEQRKK